MIFDSAGNYAEMESRRRMGIGTIMLQRGLKDPAEHFKGFVDNKLPTSCPLQYFALTFVAE